MQEVKQKEFTPFYPRSLYRVVKLYSYCLLDPGEIIQGLRHVAYIGILYNHEGLDPCLNCA